ncbi:hypothetical protein ACOSQ3_022156 [Xanthoceras sorbifolium]
MGTRNQTNAEFRNEVYEILGRHESSIDQVYGTLQTMLTELQSLRTSQNHSQPLPDINPFAPTEPSQHINPPSARWIFIAKQYFEFKEVAAEQQVQLASFHLEGITLQWHRWLAKFKALLLRFRLTDYKDPSEALIQFKQTTTVSAYEEEFEKLSHRVDELPENFLIRCNWRCLTGGGTQWIAEKGVTNFRGFIFVAPPRSLSNSLAGILGPAPGPKPSSGPNAFRKITSQEARRHYEKGLYYYYDERFIPGYRCQRPQMFMIWDMDDINEETQ